jgi:hypothetical protein
MLSNQPTVVRWNIIKLCWRSAGSQINFLCIIANWATEILRLLAQVKMLRAARGIGSLPPQGNF